MSSFASLGVVGLLLFGSIDKLLGEDSVFKVWVLLKCEGQLEVIFGWEYCELYFFEVLKDLKILIGHLGGAREPSPQDPGPVSWKRFVGMLLYVLLFLF